MGHIIILHMCTKNHNHLRYGSWDMEWDIFFCHFGGSFCPLTLLTTQKIKIHIKMKNTSGDIILLMCTKNLDHMMYASWDIEYDSFCIFNQLTTLKIEIWNKYKKQWKILSFYKCVPWMKIIWCMVPFFFNWDSLHARLNSHYQAWSYKKGSTKKITRYRKSV